jgi:mRNA-degrading endonuclease RelE of RelBE toxin-antitoxin system
MEQYVIDDVLNPGMEGSEASEQLRGTEVADAIELFSNSPSQLNSHGQYTVETGVDNERYGDLAFDPETGYASVWDEQYQEVRELFALGIAFADGEGPEYGVLALDTDDNRLEDGFYGVVTDDGDSFNRGVEEEIVTAINDVVRQRWEELAEEDDVFRYRRDPTQYDIELSGNVERQIQSFQGTKREAVDKTLLAMAERPYQKAKRQYGDTLYHAVTKDLRMVSKIDDAHQEIVVHLLGDHDELADGSRLPKFKDM